MKNKIILFISFLIVFINSSWAEVKDIPIVAQLDRPKAAEWTDEDLQSVASQYAGISDRSVNFSPEQIQRLKELNPKLFILKYISFSVIHKPKMAQRALKKYPEAALYDAKGNPEPPLWGRERKGVTFNPGHPQWREYLIDESKKIVEAGYDGLMADECLMVNELSKQFSGINPKTGRIYTTAEFRDEQYKNLKAVKDAIGQDKMIIANSVAAGTEYFKQKASRFLQVVDGVAAEGFIGKPKWPINRYFEGEDWKNNVEMLRDVDKRGKIIVATVKYEIKDVKSAGEDVSAEGGSASGGKARADIFHLSTFLLGKGEHTCLGSSIFDPKNPLDREREFLPLWEIKIGQPVGEYYEENGVYKRDFENAKVLVNPGRQTKSVNLSNTYRTLDGKEVNQITLESQSAAILMKK